jgi:mono/diheme cytochrome c family protein
MSPIAQNLAKLLSQTTIPALPILLAFLLGMALPIPVAAHGHEHHPHMQDMQGMEGHWMAPAKEALRRNPVKSTSASKARGAALFRSHCVSCHGEQGMGDGPVAADLDPKPANLQMMAGHHSDGDLAWKIAHGRGSMPTWKGVLKSKQIWDLVNYIRHLSG